MVQKAITMNPVRKRKLLLLILLVSVLATSTALVLYALRQNISLFYSPSQIAMGEAPLHHSIRVGGMVVPGSITRTSHDLSVQFKITDYAHTIDVVYRGILPDLFREGQGIVAQGQLIDNQHVRATEVLAKHDEKYMPPEVKDALAKTKQNKARL
jgi:cytochrome c-type biogenesis protein CcmE